MTQTSRRGQRCRWAFLNSPAAALLLACLAIQSVSAIKTASPTADELAHHVANGYSYLLTGNFKMNPASPPLSRMLSALPLLFLGAKAPLDHPSWKSGNSPEFANQFFYHAGNDADTLIFWARIPILFISLLFGFFLFQWTKEIFGKKAALLTLTLYVFSPDIVAHSSLATTDLCVAFFFFLSIMSFDRYLKNPTPKRLILTGLFSGLAFLSKLSAILLFPILFLIVIFTKQWKAIAPLRILSFLLVCFLTIWAGYFFEMKPLLKDTPDPDKKITWIQKTMGPQAVKWAQQTPMPLATFSAALASLVFTRMQGTNAYLMGEWSKTGWWSYYFIAFLIKNTIPFLLLFIFSLFFIKKININRQTRWAIGIPILFFFLITLNDKAQAGIRYFLPIYPFCMMLAGGFAACLLSLQVSLQVKQRLVVKMLVIGLMGWHILSAIGIYPHYLAYFNEAIGGPQNGYKWLRDSNLDWGQDLKGLAAFVKEKGYTDIALSYPWPADPGYYALPYHKPNEREYQHPQKKVYAISAHMIDAYRWHSDYSPTAVVGHTIFIYDLRSDDNASRKIK